MFHEMIVGAEWIRRHVPSMPEVFVSRICDGKLTAYAVYDGENEDCPYGISVEERNGDTLRFAWLYFTKECRNDLASADVLEYRIRAAKRTGAICGAFLELPDTHENERIIRIMKLCGMETEERKSDIYSLHVSDLVSNDSLFRQNTEAKCITLEDADDALRTEAEWLLEDSKEICGGFGELRADRYKGDLSLICKENRVVSGVLLVSESESRIVVDCLYGSTPKAVATMLGSGIKLAREKVDLSTEIIVPAVVTGSAALLKRLAPTAHRENLIRGTVSFVPPVIPPLLKKLRDNMKNDM